MALLDTSNEDELDAVMDDYLTKLQIEIFTDTEIVKHLMSKIGYDDRKIRTILDPLHNPPDDDFKEYQAHYGVFLNGRKQIPKEVAYEMSVMGYYVSIPIEEAK